MARIRSIKPSFFASEDVSALPLRARLTWIGLWTHCDDQGRCKDNVKLIKAAIWPLDNVSLTDVEEDLTTLADYGRIVRYEVAGKPYLEITNWTKHQRIQKPSEGGIPPFLNGSGNATGTLSDLSGTAPVRRGGEGKGGDARGSVPARRCLEHTGATDAPPCRACGDARREYDAWMLAQKNRPTPSAGTDGEPECPEHQGQLERNCSSCRADALARASA